MTDIYTNRNHIEIPKRVRYRIVANIEAIIEHHGDDPDKQEYMLENLIEVAYDSYHIGWQAGFIDDTQEDPDEIGAMEMAKDLASFNPGGTK